MKKETGSIGQVGDSLQLIEATRDAMHKMASRLGDFSRYGNDIVSVKEGFDNLAGMMQNFGERLSLLEERLLPLTELEKLRRLSKEFERLSNNFIILTKNIDAAQTEFAETLAKKQEATIKTSVDELTSEISNKHNSLLTNFENLQSRNNNALTSNNNNGLLALKKSLETSMDARDQLLKKEFSDVYTQTIETNRNWHISYLATNVILIAVFALYLFSIGKLPLPFTNPNNATIEQTNQTQQLEPASVDDGSQNNPTDSKEKQKKNQRGGNKR